MSTIALPDFLEDPTSFSLQLETNQRVDASPFGGSEQVIDLLNDRWSASTSIPPRTHGDAADVEAWIASMRGKTNVVNMYHLQRPEPRGNMRGTPVTPGCAPRVRVLTVVGDPGFTLRAGDMIGAAGLLLMVERDCKADGSGTCVVPLVNRVRRTIPLGSAVIWDRPTAPFRLISTSPVQYVGGYSPEISFDFVEAIV